MASSSLVHNLFDQLAKRILRAVYARAGLVESQHEVAGDAQQIDTLFRLPSSTASASSAG